MLVLLFDLDWTLLQGGNKAHADAFVWAFSFVYGVEASPSEIMTEGMTDTEIIAAVLERHVVPLPTVHARMQEATQEMTDYFIRHENDGIYVPLPGVTDTLKELRKQNILVGILTGNVEGIAWRKCEKAGIRDLIDFGAFGSESLHRPDLVPLAKQRAQAISSEAKTFIIVGDSPRDILCAQAANIQSVGVATGSYSAAELEEAGASETIPSIAALLYTSYFKPSAAK